MRRGGNFWHASTVDALFARVLSGEFGQERHPVPPPPDLPTARRAAKRKPAADAA
jgi:hypothetical protein